jgi:hypothetical protein
VEAPDADGYNAEDYDAENFDTENFDAVGSTVESEYSDSSLESCRHIFWDVDVDSVDDLGFYDEVEDEFPGDTQFEIATGLAMKNGHRALARLITSFREHKIING